MIKHIQVHLTDMCNLKCKHCYQCGSKNTEVLSIDDFKELIRQYQEVMPENDRQYVHLSITGGEPLILHNFLDYLDIAKEGGIQKLSILTNGSLLTEEILLELKRRDIDIQVSIDGNKEVNDLIRGKGTFDKIMSKIKLASGLGVKLKVSYTLNALNYECVSSETYVFSCLHLVFRSYAFDSFLMVSMPFANSFHAASSPSSCSLPRSVIM